MASIVVWYQLVALVSRYDSKFEESVNWNSVKAQLAQDSQGRQRVAAGEQSYEQPCRGGGGALLFFCAVVIKTGSLVNSAEVRHLSQ